MKTSACLVLLLLVSSMLAVDAQVFFGRAGFGRGFGGGFGRGFGGGFGGGFGPYPYPYYDQGFGRPWGPGWGAGRGLAFLGSAALLGSGNTLGQVAGGVGLACLVGFC